MGVRVDNKQNKEYYIYILKIGREVMDTEQKTKIKFDTEKIKKVFSVVEGFVNKAIYTDFYLWAVLAIVFVAWLTECAPFGFISLILVSAFVLIFANDILPLFANIFGAVLMIYTDKVDEFLYLWPVFIPLGLAIVVFVVRNIIRKKNAGDKFQLGKMFFPQVAVSVALILGGVGVVSGEGYLGALPHTLVLGVGLLAVYILARNFISTDGETDRATYFAKVLAYIGMVVSLQLVVVIIKSGLAPSEWARGNWLVGWGNRNNISTYLLFTAPMCLYLSTKYQRLGVVYMLMAVFQYVCLIMTFSRGGILFGFIALVFGIAFTIYKAKNRKMQLIFLGSVVGVMLVLYLIFMGKINDAIESLLSRGTGLSGRDELYIEGWELFKQHPFQGVGFGYIGNMQSIVHEAIGIYYFHSTAIQVIACMGIIGAVAYGYIYVVKGIILFKNPRNAFNLFVLVVFIGFEGYSMMDTGTMIPFPYMMIVTIIMCLVEMFTSTPEAIEIDKQSSKKVKDIEGEKEENAENSVCDENIEDNFQEENQQKENINTDGEMETTQNIESVVAE